MDLGLKGKVAVITGASKGIGATTARGLAAEGVDLMLAARSEVMLRSVAEDLIRDYGVRAEICRADLTTPDGGDRVIAAATAAYGRVDIVVTSAGASQGGLFWEIPDHVWEDSLSLKFMATVRTLRAAIPVMRAQGYGRVVVVVGSNGKQPSSRLLPGGAANAALLVVVKGLADEVAADGIVVNAVSPGPTRTERWTGLMERFAAQRGVSIAEVESEHLKDIPMKRLGEPDEIARLITFLASDAAANITGISVTADGGWTKSLA